MINSTGLFFLFYFFMLSFAYVFGSNLVMNTYEDQFWVLTIVLLSYHILELVILYRKEKTLFFVKPVVLGVIVIFFLQFGGITNFIMKKNNGDFATFYNNALVNEPYWLSLAMSVVLAASVAYWVGYKLSLGSQVYRYYISTYNRFWTYNVAQMRLFYGWIVGCIIKLVINYYGAIGHKYIILTLENEYIPPYIVRLKVFENLSLLFFIMLLYLFYQQKKNRFLAVVVILGFIFELAFAVTSGARFTIIMLFLAIFLVDYISTKRLKLVWVFVLSGVLYISMTLIASYKDYIFHNTRQMAKDANSIESFQKAMDYNNERQETLQANEKVKEAARIAVVARFNYVNELSQMIRYRELDQFRPNDPNFIFPFVTFPVFAVFPKYYLFGIEDPRYGYWATKRLTGGRRTSTAISPIGFSYLAGGPFLVMLVFLVLGIMMKWVGLLMNNIKTVVGLVLFLSLLATLVMFDSIVTGSYINIIRYSLLLPIVLWVFLRSSSKQKVKLEHDLSTP